MTFNFKIGPGLLNISKRYEDKVRKDSAKELERQLEQAIGQIVSRTQSGKDINGQPFKPYTREYKNYKNGLTPSGKPTDKLTKRRRQRLAAGILARGDVENLTYTGRMLQGIRSKVTASANQLIGRLFFLPTEADKARGNQKLRPFFGLSDSQVAQIMDAIRDKLK